MNMRIADNTTRTKHREEISFFNALIIDLKKCVIHGHTLESRGVTMDRLNEATQMLAKIEQCKEQVRFK